MSVKRNICRLNEIELRVAWLYTRGIPTKRIAYECKKTVPTVRVHLSRVKTKLEVPTLQSIPLVMLGIDQSLLPEEYHDGEE